MTRAALMSPDDVAEDGDFVITQTAEDISSQQNDIDDQLSNIFSELGSSKDDINFTLSIWRVMPNKAEMAFLFKCTPAELPIMERLRDEYEGGQFHVQVYKNKKRFKRFTVHVEPPKRNTVKEVKSEMAEMIKAVADQQERQFNMLRETMMQMVGKPSTPAPSQIETMTVMMGLMKSMKDFAAPAQPVNTVSPDKMIDILMKGMELGRDSGGGSETNFLDIVKEALKSPLLLSAASGAMSSIPSLPQVKASPQLNSPGSNPVNKPVQSEAPKMNMLEHNLNMLISKAEKDSDPVLYAEFILDNVPEEIINQYILRDDLIEELVKINPKVANHKEWFLALRNHIQGVLTDEGEAGDTEEHAPDPLIPDTTNSGGDGGDAGNA